MPCHNYAAYVEEAVRSIAAQSVTPAEVVVVDDGSTDASAHVLKDLAGELGDRIPLRVVSQENRGLIRVLNEGAAATTSPYILFVSADDRARPQLVERLAAALDAHPDAGVAYSKMTLFGDEVGVSLTYPFSPGRLIFDHNYVPGAAMVRRAALEAVGGFRELPAHEDWDLWLAMVECGWRGVLVPEELYEWRRHGAARNHQSARTKRRLRMDIVAAHKQVLVRYAHVAIPYSAAALWRRVRLRFGPPPPYARTASGCWVERPVTAARR
jgi:glycosyltransferase involved in cell wall biosynthesis